MEWKLWKRKQVKITPACPTDGKLLKMLPCAQKQKISMIKLTASKIKN